MRVVRPHELKTHELRTSQRKDTKNIPICVLKKQPLAKLQHLAVINHSINLFFNIIPHLYLIDGEIIIRLRLTFL